MIKTNKFKIGFEISNCDFSEELITIGDVFIVIDDHKHNLVTPGEYKEIEEIQANMVKNMVAIASNMEGNLEKNLINILFNDTCRLTLCGWRVNHPDAIINGMKNDFPKEYEYLQKYLLLT